MRPLLAFALAFVLSIPASAQSWPTHDWTVYGPDFGPLPDSQQALADTYRRELREAGRWLEAHGFPAPDLVREGRRTSLGGRFRFTTATPENTTGPYLAHIRDDRRTADASYSGTNVDDDGRMKLGNTLVATTDGRFPPSTGWDYFFTASPAHELVHAVHRGYGYHAYSPSTAAASAPCTGPLRRRGTPTGWVTEGVAGAVQIRWLEVRDGRPYPHPWEGGSHAWVRHFDDPLYFPRHDPQAESRASPVVGESWACDYGAWWFWYVAGELLEAPGGIAHVPHVFQAMARIGTHRTEWSDHGVSYLDTALRMAAREFGSPSDADEGFYELYPRFIASYAADERFYGDIETVRPRGSFLGSDSGTLEMLNTRAWRVEIDVPEGLDEPVPFTVALPPQDRREDLHLAVGSLLAPRPQEAGTEYAFTVPVSRDTTVLVRLAHAPRVLGALVEAPYEIRFQLGDFFDPAQLVLEGTGVPPGFFSVTNGPDALIGCSGGPDGGSEFDLVSRDEREADLQRRMGLGAEMDENVAAMQRGEIPIPGASRAQRREAFRRMMQNASPAERKELEDAVAAAARESFGDEETPSLNEMMGEWRNRSLLLLYLKGTDARPCDVRMMAWLDGNDGGPQSVPAEAERAPDGEPETPNVSVLMDPAPFEAEGWEICTMTAQERVEEAERSSCPRLCSEGELRLSHASQNRARGTLQLQLVRETSTSGACPALERRDLLIQFDIASGQSGMDADTWRGLGWSDLFGIPDPGPLHNRVGPY
ncbi:MAG: hypothetical protein AAGI52_08730 [Bacteroidota bacterium]